MRLAGKGAVIAAGGQGVGRGIALAMARPGADIALTGRTADLLDRTVGEIEALGRGAALRASDDARDPTGATMPPDGGQANFD